MLYAALRKLTIELETTAILHQLPTPRTQPPRQPRQLVTWLLQTPHTAPDTIHGHRSCAHPRCTHGGPGPGGPSAGWGGVDAIAARSVHRRMWRRPPPSKRAHGGSADGVPRVTGAGRDNVYRRTCTIRRHHCLRCGCHHRPRAAPHLMCSRSRDGPEPFFWFFVLLREEWKTGFRAFCI